MLIPLNLLGHAGRKVNKKLPAGRPVRPSNRRRSWRPGHIRAKSLGCLASGKAWELGNGPHSFSQTNLGSGKPYVVVARNIKCQM
jgi:hypothetical protein